MKALLFERSVPRLAAARLVSQFGSGRGAKVAPLRLVDADPPRLPAPGWHRVIPTLSGICGSDLATLDGRSSRYFEALVSFPFVPGHEVVGTLEGAAVAADGSLLAAGDRVVIQPALGCQARGLQPLCPSCSSGHLGDCERVALGHVKPGIQTGFCADTGGGWSAAGLVAHESQLFFVPEALSDADAVTVEPLACAIHGVLGAGLHAEDVVAIIGAGSLGLLTLAAMTWLGATGAVAAPKAVLVGARYPAQRRLADDLGATAVLAPEQLGRAVRRRSRSLTIGASGSRLTGGADVIFDCVGTSDSIGHALEMVRPRGTVVLIGMPGRVSLDLAPLWHREVRLCGAYAYGIETTRSEATPTFALALEAAAAMRTGRLVSATYPLERFEDAVAHAGAAGRRGAIKIAFEPRRSTTARGGLR